ncbi:T9SS type A sorting domain-containing protein [Ascidiimonas sp. W6]|uniref:T9SS type A sorting domain-containing protein n=1 Tax=Ascidiimonas meishanensis TaxID=3128903 RepID=UPI0030EEB514
MRQLYFAFLLCSILVNAQDIKIKDANFERALIERGFDVGNPDGLINRNAVGTVTFLDVSGESIEDLSGIEAFESLQTLIADNNEISLLNLSENAQIKEVSMYNNKLSSVNFSQNSKLEKLNAFKNKLGSIDLSNNRNLTYLAIADNNLTELNLFNNKQLETLYCQDNQLSSLNISNTPELKILNCEYNNIVDLSIENDTKLEILNASNNNLKTLEVPTNSALQQINVMYNSIAELDLSQNKVLTAILVGYNSLSSLNIRNGNNDNLQIFRAEGNDALECITVDDMIADTNAENVTGRWNKDYNTGFSANCKAAVNNSIVQKSFTFFVGTDRTLNINSDQKASLQILNLQGVAVISKNLEEGLNAINLNNALSDVYVLQINSEYGTYTKKFILN